MTAVIIEEHRLPPIAMVNFFYVPYLFENLVKVIDSLASKDACQQYTQTCAYYFK